MRVFAGPKGSGKSTIKDALKPAWIGAYLNADDIERALREGLGVALPKLGLAAQGEGLAAALRSELAGVLPAWLERSSLWDAFRPDRPDIPAPSAELR